MASNEPRNRTELQVGALAIAWPAAPIPAAFLAFTIVAVIGGASPQVGFELLGLDSWGPPITAAASSTLVLPFLFRYLRRTGNSARAIGFRVFRWYHAPLGFAAALAFIVSLAPIIDWGGERIGLQPLVLPPAPSSALQVALAVLFVGIAGPISEEVLFRGFLLGYLRPRVDSIVAVFVLASVAFALPHWLSGGPGGAFQTLFWAPIAIGLYLWQRSIYPAIAFHMSNNLIRIYLLANMPAA